MANCLIVLDKCPGIRPIGINECLRCIVGKAVMLAAANDVKSIQYAAHIDYAQVWKVQSMS